MFKRKVNTFSMIYKMKSDIFDNPDEKKRNFDLNLKKA